MTREILNLKQFIIKLLSPTINLNNKNWPFLHRCIMLIKLYMYYCVKFLYAKYNKILFDKFVLYIDE